MVHGENQMQRFYCVHLVWYGRMVIGEVDDAIENLTFKKLH